MPIKTLILQDAGPFSGKQEFDLPAVCLIQGGNGVGKTGLQDCIKFVGSKGHDPDMIHGAAEFGEITVVMDDGNQMRARITRDETVRAWKPKDGKRWIINRAYIDEVCNALAFDPLRFLEKDAQEQAQELLKLVALPPCPTEILIALGAQHDGGAPWPIDIDIRNLPALQAIDAVYDSTYAERTRLNTSADSLEKHVAELTRTLPAGDGKDWGARAVELRAEKAKIESDQRGVIGKLNNVFLFLKKKAEDVRSAAYTAADQACAAAKEAADAICSSDIEQARKAGQDDADAARANASPEISRLTAELSQAELLATQEAQAQGTRAAIEKAGKEAAEKRQQWAAHNAAVENLRKLRTQQADQLKIKGVTVKEGRIVREQDGGWVPLKKWNTADQRKLALRIGMLIGQKAGFVVVDHVESFDRDQRAALLATCSKYAEENGIQFILASVSPYNVQPEPFKVVDGNTKRKPA